MSWRYYGERVRKTIMQTTHTRAAAGFGLGLNVNGFLAHKRFPFGEN